MDLEEAFKKLREPFPANQISKLPKPTKGRDEMAKISRGTCKICGGYHAISNIIHLDYVGHAALTDRLLDVDPEWSWVPMAVDQNGLPLFDKQGGLWIRLTVCGVTKPGYGHADGKTGGDAIKEIIGDAIRNAAMRFGCALDLWHKGDLHAHHEDEEASTDDPAQLAQAESPQKTGPYAHPWSVDELEEFELTKDRAYAAFKAAGKTVDDFNAFAETWKKNQMVDPAEMVLTRFAAIVGKLEEASKKKASE